MTSSSAPRSGPAARPSPPTAFRRGGVPVWAVLLALVTIQVAILVLGWPPHPK
jgi:hypothetical protein